MPLEIRAIKRKSTSEEVPEPTQETATSQETSSTNKDNPASKKKKKTNKTVTSEPTVETKSAKVATPDNPVKEQESPEPTVETKSAEVATPDNTVKEQESPPKSEIHSSQPTAKSKKSPKKSKVQAVANPDNIEGEKKPLDSSESLPLEPSPSKAKKDTPSESSPASFFQAIGFIQGVIVRGENQRTGIQIGSKVYKLYAHAKLLKKLEIGKEFVLRVYPSIANQKQIFGFKALCIYNGNPEQKIKAEDAIPNRFILKGIWQFYGKSQDTVISIFRNEKRYPQDSCKPTHLPLSWENPEVTPFCFNPNLTKEDKKPARYFVEMQAKFLPEEGLFVFDSLLAKPTEKIPKHLKEIKPAQKTKTEQPIDSGDTEAEPKQLPENILEENQSVLTEVTNPQTENPLT